nr:putative late blight resistance protein homolog R1B-17 isoform X1 [Ipomoea trifida]
MYTIDDPPSVVTMNLQTLSWVSPTHCGREVNFNFPNIRKVELFYKEDLVPSHIGSSSSNPITLYNLDNLEWLERLTISISIGCIVTLPKRFMFPSQLKKLKLSGTKLSQRDLTTIGIMLPELRVLKLENALLGRVWEVAEGEFCKLKFLLIEDKKLKQLQIDETNTLLRLEQLVLRCCYCLEQIPLSFVGRNLKHIELDGCNPSIVASAKQLYRNQFDHLSRRAESMLIINHGNGVPTFDLEASQISGSSSNCFSLDKLDYLGQLKSLTISVSVGCIVTLPDRCIFPLQLKKLKLSGTNLSGRDLTVIGTLQWLEVLKLENAFHEKVWEVAEGGFYRLRLLVLKDKKLERLEAYTDSFPCLEHLVLRCCECLEEICSSFGEIFCFKSIEMDRFSHCPSIVASARDIQEKLKKNFGKENFEIKIQGQEQGPEYIEDVEKANS